MVGFESAQTEIYKFNMWPFSDDGGENYILVNDVNMRQVFLAELMTKLFATLILTDKIRFEHKYWVIYMKTS